MAFRMKHFVAATLFCMVLVAVWQLPPESHPVRSSGPLMTGERLRHDRLADDLHVTVETLRREVWADSLSSLVVNNAEDGVLVATPRPLGPTPQQSADGSPSLRERDAALEAQERRLAEVARGEIRALGDQRADMVFGYVVQPHEQNLLPGMNRGGRSHTETFAGSAEGRDYCLQLRMTDRATAHLVIARRLAGADRTAPRSDLLGACRFFLEYGMPSDRLHAWLEDGGADFALESGPEEKIWTLTPRIIAPIGLAPRRWLFGLSYGNRPIELDQCLTGRTEACSAIFAHPERYDERPARTAVVRRTPAISTGGSLHSTVLSPDEAYLLADLEAEFGHDAFARFWTSDEALEEAFEDAFGIDAGRWVLQWMGRTTTIDEPGPAMPRSASGGSMAFMAVLLGFAFMRNRGRKVG